MRKKDEQHLTNTCLNSAHPEEMVFVLLGRDPAAPVAIRAWVAERVGLGKNALADAQIAEALACAATMEAEGRRRADGIKEMGALVNATDHEYANSDSIEEQF